MIQIERSAGLARLLVGVAGISQWHSCSYVKYQYNKSIKDKKISNF